MSQPHRFDPTMLREYDVRGIIDKTLTAADARALGRSFGTMVRRSGGQKVAVGYDGRLSSPMLEAALVDGLMACGCAVTRVGLGPTPMLYYAVYALGLDAGMMITGSHNPPDYNGFKMLTAKGPFYGADIQQLGVLAAAADWENGSGSETSVFIEDRYVERLLDGLETKPFRIAWDPGNGAAGTIVAKLAARLPGEHVLLNCTIDGTFPAHHPDPTEEKNLVQLRQAVADGGLDFGIAFDGDGDRIGAIDSTGRVIWGDQLLQILAADVLAAVPGATIIADVKASQALFDRVTALGGKPLMWRTGHSLIKAKMKETGSPLAGEMSGHIFFAHNYYGFDDALYAALRLMSAVTKQGGSLTALRDAMPELVNTPELRFPCSEERKFGVVQEVLGRLRASGATLNDTDGARVNSADGWWLLRASNTQDVLVARAEAADQAGLDRLMALLTDQLAASGVALPEGPVSH
jgi:phosphomannomutase